MAVLGGGMSTTVPPDNTKAVESFIVNVAAGAAAAQVVTPTVPMQSAFVYNATSNLMQGTVTFNAGITGVNVAAKRVFLVPAGATHAVDFSAHDGDNAVGAVDTILSISFRAVLNGTGVVSGDLAPAATAAIAGPVYVNLASA